MLKSSVSWGPRLPLLRLRILCKLNLTALLAVLAIVDLLGRRILARMLLPHSALAVDTNRVLMAGVSFTGHLTTILGLVVLLWVLSLPRTRRELFPGAVQISLVFIMGCFSVLAVRQLLQPFLDRLSIYLQLSYSFLALFVLIGLWHERGGAVIPLRARIGVTLFIWPAFVAVLVVFCDRAGFLRDGPLLSWLARLGDLGLLLAPALAPWLLPPSSAPGRPRAWLGPGIAGALLGVAGMATFFLRFDLLQSVARYGLRIVLPPPGTAYGYAYAALLGLGLSGATSAALRLWAAGASDRLIAYGLILVQSSGGPDAQPAGLVVSLAGFLALNVGLRRHAHAAANPVAPPARAEAALVPDPG